MQTFTKDEPLVKHQDLLEQRVDRPIKTLKMPLKPQRKGRNNHAT
jgi:hypothetical protein